MNATEENHFSGMDSMTDEQIEALGETLRKAVSEGGNGGTPKWLMNRVAAAAGGMLILISSWIGWNFQSAVAKQEEMFKILLSHTSEPWHEDAGEAIRSNQREINNISREVVEIRSKQETVADGVKELLRRTEDQK